ncbi:MAG: PQQ-dependent sugar dehydrogenase, partial [Planctomycetota bacterium]
MMLRTVGTTVCAFTLATTLTPDASGQTTPCNIPGSGADVIVGSLPDVQNYSSNGGIEAFAVGTTSCNVGDAPLLWIANNNQHPVIAQNFFKIDPDAGTFEHLGQSWLKHGFFALQQNLCCSCSPTASDRLGVGCSDPYGAGLNGDAPDLGPKSEVNAHTGFFTYPPSDPLPITPNVGRRLQVPTADLVASSGSNVRYFVEGHYVAPDDAAAGNGNNNASYREMTVSGSGSSWNFSLIGSTVREQPGIRAWKTVSPNVLETDVQIPNEGLLIVASLATDNGNGTWHYEYVVHNLNSDRSVNSFEVPVGNGVNVTNIGFHDVNYHSGESYADTDWVGVRTASTVIWSTDDFGTDSDANAIRWGTSYTFRFDANFGPEDNNATLGIFKPGTPTTVNGLVRTPPLAVGPQDCNNNGVEDSIDIANGDALDCNGNFIPDDCETFAECDLELELIASGLNNPVGVYAASGDFDRLFVVQQGGRIRIVDLNTKLVNATDFLNINGQITSGGERGLLSMAFDPAYDSNGFFYLNYTNVAGDTVISRWSVSGDPDVANPGSEVILKTITQDFANHNGGQLQFGPDGYLYCGMGDGGSANDPFNRSQDPGSLLGKMLRLDTTNAPTYDAPGNVSGPIWADGLRNPWRFAFDRVTDDLWIADVGQDAREEINFVAAGAAPGLDFGWRCMEGTLCTGLSGCTCNSGILLPIKEEFHTDNITCSITGGYVYRGCDIPWMHGRYFYSDLCGNYIRSFKYDADSGSVFDERDHTSDIPGLSSIVSFGEDAAGEMYIVSGGSQIHRIICEQIVVEECGNGTIETGEECDPPNGVNCDCNCQLIDGTALFVDDFNTDQGWTATNNGASSGDWQRGVPVNDNAWAYDPIADGDGSGAAYLTQNQNGNTDVDGGSVTLTSPMIDMSAGSIVVEYDYYLNLTDSGNTDSLLVEVNDNNGVGAWATIANHNSSGGLDWRHHTVTQTDIENAGVSLTSSMRVRFTASDNDPQSINEAGVDGFVVTTTSSYSDCNNNCIEDAIDIANGTSFDCNENGTPDECEGGGDKVYPVAISPPLSIPDGAATFVSDVFTVPDSGTITDLDVALNITHTWNGDVTVRLTHNGVTVVLVDRPGFPAADPDFGFDNDGFDIVLDDEGTGGAIEDLNSGGGIVSSPPSYTPANPLSIFDGMEKQGDWIIEVSDAVGQDSGTLDFWELRIANTGSAVSPCDCNNNGIEDSLDIASQFSADCNNNGEPDECEIAANPMLDCDGGPTGAPSGGNLIINTFCFGCHNTDG